MTSSANPWSVVKVVKLPIAAGLWSFEGAVVGGVVHEFKSVTTTGNSFVTGGTRSIFTSPPFECLMYEPPTFVGIANTTGSGFSERFIIGAGLRLSVVACVPMVSITVGDFFCLFSF